jgi:hypothetical protein
MKTTLIAMWVGIGMLVASWLNPPMSRVGRDVDIYWGRLALIDAVIVAVTVGAIITIRRWKSEH